MTRITVPPITPIGIRAANVEKERRAHERNRLLGKVLGIIALVALFGLIGWIAVAKVAGSVETV